MLFETTFVTALEPDTWMLVLTGAIALSFVAWRRRKK